MPVSDRAQRPFWFHQLAEYIIGLALLVAGFQDAEPTLLAIAGGLILVNAAMVHGPFGAFKFVGRKLHRSLDIVIIALLLVGAGQPWFAVSVVGRATLILIAVPYAFLWWYTDWTVKPAAPRRATKPKTRPAATTNNKSTSSKPTSSIGHTAGRLTGKGWRKAKRAVEKFNDDR